MPKKSLDSQKLRTVEYLVRGGFALSNASQIAGVSYTGIRYKMKKIGTEILKIRAIAKRRPHTLAQIGEAIQLLISGASPEDVFLMTNITMTQLSIRFDEILMDSTIN